MAIRPAVPNPDNSLDFPVYAAWWLQDPCAFICCARSVVAYRLVPDNIGLCGSPSYLCKSIRDLDGGRYQSSRYQAHPDDDLTLSIRHHSIRQNRIPKHLGPNRLHIRLPGSLPWHLCLLRGTRITDAFDLLQNLWPIRKLTTEPYDNVGSFQLKCHKPLSGCDPLRGLYLSKKRYRGAAHQFCHNCCQQYK